ncbi:MAG: hypothetical protein M5U25_08525 [Planctomycetota bacterium]|nr:hypothetical protein [Planctomycetota bacterium]
MKRKGIAKHLIHALKNKGGPAEGPSSITAEQMREWKALKAREHEENRKRYEERRRKSA